MNALFLDIDGVLCFGRKHMHHIEESKIRLLKKIQAETGVRIVLISVWRKTDWTVNKLIKVFQKYKIEWDTADKTENHIYIGVKARPFEIRDFLSEHPEITKFAVLDDENHQSFGQHMFHADNKRKTPGEILQQGLLSEVGLTKELTNEIINYFNSNRPLLGSKKR